METIESLRERVEVLEHHTEALIHRAHLIERRLRWWCALACGLLVLGLFSLPLPSSTAQEEYSGRGLAKRLAALEYKLVHITSGPDDVTITGANLRIVNGLGDTETTNGLGNLIVGYNELRNDLPRFRDVRTGSHNIVLGKRLNFSSFGGFVGGDFNQISGAFASVSVGAGNTASGQFASITGGQGNTASGDGASVSGGQANTASGDFSSVTGGGGEGNGGGRNTASGLGASVTGGFNNTASGFLSSISGGQANTASGFASSVSGGLNRSAPATDNWAAGPLSANN
jgi:hypothetical protein